MRLLVTLLTLCVAILVVESSPGGWGWEEPPRPPPTKGWRPPPPPPPTKGWRPPPPPPTKGWRPPPPPTKGWKPPPPPPKKGWGWGGDSSEYEDEAPIIKYYCETLRRIVNYVSECPKRPRPRPGDNHGGYQKGQHSHDHGGYNKGHSGYVPRHGRGTDTEDYDWKW